MYRAIFYKWASSYKCIFRKFFLLLLKHNKSNYSMNLPIFSILWIFFPSFSPNNMFSLLKVFLTFLFYHSMFVWYSQKIFHLLPQAWRLDHIKAFENRQNFNIEKYSQLKCTCLKTKILLTLNWFKKIWDRFFKVDGILKQ